MASLQIAALELEVALQRHDAALARLDTLQAATPRPERWLVERGDVLVSAGRPADALTSYRDASAALERLPARHRRTRTSEALAALVSERVDQLARELQATVSESSN